MLIKIRICIFNIYGALYGAQSDRHFLTRPIFGFLKQFLTLFYRARVLHAGGAHLFSFLLQSFAIRCRPALKSDVS